MRPSARRVGSQQRAALALSAQVSVRSASARARILTYARTVAVGLRPQTSSDTHNERANASSAPPVDGQKAPRRVREWGPLIRVESRRPSESGTDVL